MSARKQKIQKQEPAAGQSRVTPAVLKTILNMAVSTSAVGAVLLCLVAAKHFT